MKITLLPKTKLGTKSVLMIIASWVLFVVGSVLPSKIGNTFMGNIIKNPIQTIITLLIFTIGIVAFFMGLQSVIKTKERSILVFLAILLGLYSILGLFGFVVNLFSKQLFY